MLRLERISENSASPLLLVEYKVQSQTVLAFLTLSFVVWNGNTAVFDYAHNFFSMPMEVILSSSWWCFWIGAGTTSLATWAQVVGQARVGPSRSAVFYSAQAVWAAGMACAIGLDQLTLKEVFGGGLIVAAGALLALADIRENQKKK